MQKVFDKQFGVRSKEFGVKTFKTKTEEFNSPNSEL